MSIAAQQRQAASPKYNPSFGWSSVHQPQTLATVEEYIALAEQNLPYLEEKIQEFLGTLPFETDLIGPCVKGAKRANQKLFDNNSTAKGDPQNVRDYLRLTISPRTVEELEQTIKALENHSMTVGWKNRFYSPEPSTGMRDYKAIWCVGCPSDDMAILAEIKVDFAGMQPAYKFTETLRSSERKLAEFKENAMAVCCSSRDKPEARKRISIMQADAMETAESLRKIRKDVHDTAAHNLGLNVLLDPELTARHKPAAQQDVTAHVNDARGTGFGEKMLGSLSAEVIVLASAAKRAGSAPEAPQLHH
jgi:hypothetical protein